MCLFTLYIGLQLNQIEENTSFVTAWGNASIWNVIYTTTTAAKEILEMYQVGNYCSQLMYVILRYKTEAKSYF
jgi:hypothetical protein